MLVALVVVLISGGACWAPPVNAPITDPYRAPPCTYCPGNRGIEFGPRPGQAVSAVHEGVVSFAGTVAGTRYVVIDHPDGLRATYGRLATVEVHRGDSVDAGDRVGTTGDGFYFGLRRGAAPNDHPVDPTPMLGVRTYPPRLIPVDGTPAPSPGPGRLTCGNSAGGR